MNASPAAIASARRFTRILTLASLSPAISLISYVAYVKWKLHKSTHRPFTPDDMYYIRTMDGSTLSIMDNPGIRVEPDFLSVEEQEKLRFETKIMLSLYGYSSIPFWTRPNWNKQIAGLLSKTRVNSIKVTGKDPKSVIAEPPMTEHAQTLRQEQEAALIKTKPYEANDPVQAPWKNSHSFDFNALPKAYQDLVNKIRELSDYKLGSVRDFSIDYRENRYFRLDPHITTGLDAVTVFMVSLESDGVITVVPPEKEVYRRASTKQIAKESWTDKDMDILHRRGDLLCLSDRARDKLEWSMRLGIDARTKGLKQIVKNKYVSKNLDGDDEGNDGNELDEDDDLFGSVIVGNEDIVNKMDENDDQYVLCDWWGTSKHLIPRNEDKILITVSFARPT